MITPLLEKAIAKGQATYSRHTHALSMFGSVKIPENSTIIITDIKWHHFINPWRNDGGQTINDFFKYNEWQMKVDGFKSTNYLFYRNGVQPDGAAMATLGMDMADPISGYVSALPFKISDPVVENVFFICQKYIHITIQRNSFAHTTVSSFGQMGPEVAELPPPNGVGTVDVLRRLRMNAFGPLVVYQTPVGNDAAQSGPTDPRNAEPYYQDVDPTYSLIWPPDTFFNATINRIYQTQPLVEFGMVTINSALFDQLGNS